jgi:hypothetical protein
MLDSGSSAIEGVAKQQERPSSMGLENLRKPFSTVLGCKKRDMTSLGLSLIAIRIEFLELNLPILQPAQILEDMCCVSSANISFR